MRFKQSDHFFGGVLRRARERAGLSQAALAELCGVTQPAVARWETGRQAVFEATIETVAQALGTTVEKLLRAEFAARDILPGRRRRRRTATLNGSSAARKGVANGTARSARPA